MSPSSRPYKPRATRRTLNNAQQEARIRAAHAVSLQRANPSLSLSRAAQHAGTTPTTVRRYFPRSYTRTDANRWQVQPSDREPFAMTVLSVEEGPVARVIRGSKQRSLVGGHFNAVRNYLSPGGDPEVLNPYIGRRVAGLTLQTDPDELIEMWRSGHLDFLEIYALAH
jgi:hypothetical protein